MKTSTKIFMGLAAAAVAVCVVNVFVTVAMHKIHDVEARRILTGLDAGPIRVLELTLMPDLDSEMGETIRDFWRGRTQAFDTAKQRIYVSASALEGIRVDSETLRVEIDSESGNMVGMIRMTLTSNSLEKVVIHETGRADEVIEIRPAPETEAEPEIKIEAGEIS